MPHWSAPVRFVEVDQQGVVFNAHYLTYCDEALSAYLGTRLADGGELSAQLRLVTSTLTWRRSARLGDTIDVEVRCDGIGRTSLTLTFVIGAGGHVCCSVATTYVLVDDGGAPTPVPDGARAILSS